MKHPGVKGFVAVAVAIAYAMFSCGSFAVSPNICDDLQPQYKKFRAARTAFIASKTGLTNNSTTTLVNDYCAPQRAMIEAISEELRIYARDRCGVSEAKFAQLTNERATRMLRSQGCGIPTD